MQDVTKTNLSVRNCKEESFCTKLQTGFLRHEISRRNPPVRDYREEPFCTRLQRGIFLNNEADGLTRAAPQARRYRLCPEQGRHLNGGLPDWTRERSCHRRPPPEGSGYNNGKQVKTQAWQKLSGNRISGQLLPMHQKTPSSSPSSDLQWDPETHQEKNQVENN